MKRVITHSRPKRVQSFYINVFLFADFLFQFLNDGFVECKKQNTFVRAYDIKSIYNSRRLS